MQAAMLRGPICNCQLKPPAPSIDGQSALHVPPVPTLLLRRVGGKMQVMNDEELAMLTIHNSALA